MNIHENGTGDASAILRIESKSWMHVVWLDRDACIFDTDNLKIEQTPPTLKTNYIVLVTFNSVCEYYNSFKQD